MSKILIVEDDPIVQKLLDQSLKRDYKLTFCPSVAEAKSAIENENYDLFILDRVLNDGDGIDLCRSIREDESKVDLPIIFLSGRTSETERLMGFYSGCNDYVAKPFSVLELKARVDLQLKKGRGLILLKNLEIDQSNFSVRSRVSTDYSHQLELTPLEFKILVYFAQNKENILTRTMLLDRVWGTKMNVSDRTIDTHISHLRKKLAKFGVNFESLRGEGYKLKDAA